jgi:hypothetical protein
MDKINLKTGLGIALILGSVWGFAEAALGFGLHRCAANMSGSLMTGVALFFICASWVSTKRFYAPVITVLIACIFKLFDAVLLDQKIISGAVANPIFAFLTEGLAIIGLAAIISYKRLSTRSSRALLGAGSALVAVCLFPLVKFFTGIPACLYGSTGIPLSIVFGPVAIALSAITVPLAFPVGEWIASLSGNIETVVRPKAIKYLISPGALALCLALIVLFRMIFPESVS